MLPIKGLMRFHFSKSIYSEVLISVHHMYIFLSSFSKASGNSELNFSINLSCLNKLFFGNKFILDVRPKPKNESKIYPALYQAAR